MPTIVAVLPVTASTTSRKPGIVARLWAVAPAANKIGGFTPALINARLHLIDPGDPDSRRRS